MTLYLNPHRSQYAPTASARTLQSGCTWASGANGADASTGGAIAPLPDAVLAKVAANEETSPATPGWSLQDLALAMSRLGVGFVIRSGTGWLALEKALDVYKQYVVLQGDSDQFANATCSGAFDGDHAIGVHPQRDAAGRQLINDPICPTGRWETRAVLRAYAEKLSPTVRFGVFSSPVPAIAQEADDVIKITRHKTEAWKPKPGQGALRTTPDRAGPVALRLLDTDTLYTHFELDTLARTDPKWPTHGNWRGVDRGDGIALYMLRDDYVALVQGGDPALDAKGRAFRANPAASTGVTDPAVIEAARREAAAAAVTAERIRTKAIAGEVINQAAALANKAKEI